jgi:hypothetical protein
VQGGGGGGGGTCEPATAWSADWTPIYDRDFTALADADILPGGDGNITLDGKTVYARNVSRMASLDVGPIAGGIKLGLGAVSEASDYYGSTLNGPALEWGIAQFFTGTDFEGRNDVEMRFLWKVARTGTPNSAVFEHLTLGMRTSSHDGNKRIQILQGGTPGNTDARQVYTETSGSLSYGELVKDDADLAYTPNVLAAEFLENYLKMSYSSSASADIADTLIVQYATDRTAATQKLVKQAGASAEGLLFFAHGKSGGVAGITAITLAHLRVEARFSPRGLGAFVP